MKRGLVLDVLRLWTNTDNKLSWGQCSTCWPNVLPGTVGTYTVNDWGGCEHHQALGWNRCGYAVVRRCKQGYKSVSSSVRLSLGSGVLTITMLTSFHSESIMLTSCNTACLILFLPCESTKCHSRDSYCSWNYHRSGFEFCNRSSRLQRRDGLVVWSLAPPVCTSKCPQTRYWSPNSSRCAWICVCLFLRSRWHFVWTPKLLEYEPVWMLTSTLSAW